MESLQTQLDQANETIAGYQCTFAVSICPLIALIRLFHHCISQYPPSLSPLPHYLLSAPLSSLTPLLSPSIPLLSLAPSSTLSPPLHCPLLSPIHTRLFFLQSPLSPALSLSRMPMRFCASVCQRLLFCSAQLDEVEPDLRSKEEELRLLRQQLENTQLNMVEYVTKVATLEQQLKSTVSRPGPREDDSCKLSVCMLRMWGVYVTYVRCVAHRQLMLISYSSSCRWCERQIKWIGQHHHHCQR